MKNRNIIVLGGLLLILLVAGWFVSGSNSDSESLPETQEQQVSQNTLYFAGELTRPASPDDPIPIEGYDAGLLLGRYPGLVYDDFDGVEALQGIYAVGEEDIMFTFTAEYEHSAARTISSKGYETLLENISKRLNLPIATQENIDTLLAEIR